MSTFQCECCGAVENTATSFQGHRRVSGFHWTYIESLKGLRICYRCGPTVWRDNKPIEKRDWHRRFHLDFLPLGRFKTEGYEVVDKETLKPYSSDEYVTHPTHYKVTLADGTVIEQEEAKQPRREYIKRLMQLPDPNVVDVGVYTKSGTVCGIPESRVYHGLLD